MAHGGNRSTKKPARERGEEVWLPKEALFCHRAMHAPPAHAIRYCKNCNAVTTVGAREKIVLRAGDCHGGDFGDRMEVTSTSATFAVPVVADIVDLGSEY